MGKTYLTWILNILLILLIFVGVGYSRFEAGYNGVDSLEFKFRAIPILITSLLLIPFLFIKNSWYKVIAIGLFVILSYLVVTVFYGQITVYLIDNGRY